MVSTLTWTFTVSHLHLSLFHSVTMPASLHSLKREICCVIAS